MKRSLPGLSGLHTRSVLAAASRSLHFSRNANFCLRLPRAHRELSRGYTTGNEKEPPSGGLIYFPKRFALARNYSIRNPGTIRESPQSPAKDVTSTGSDHAASQWRRLPLIHHTSEIGLFTSSTPFPSWRKR
jgi:hypothetical protein